MADTFNRDKPNTNRVPHRIIVLKRLIHIRNKNLHPHPPALTQIQRRLIFITCVS